jgi:hypothetical protein
LSLAAEKKLPYLLYQQLAQAGMLHAGELELFYPLVVVRTRICQQHLILPGVQRMLGLL